MLTVELIQPEVNDQAVAPAARAQPVVVTAHNSQLRAPHIVGLCRRPDRPQRLQTRPNDQSKTTGKNGREMTETRP